MFNLEQAITEWRRQMLNSGIKAPVPLDELESHLREDMERQMRSGLNERQAFEAAIKRIGQADSIKNEFAKVGLMKEAREQKLRIIFLMVAGFLYSLFVITCVFSKFGSFASITRAEQASSLAALGLTVLFGVSAFFIHRFLPVIPGKRVRAKVYVCGGMALSVWLVIFYYFVLMHFDFTLSQLAVACLWAMSPVGAFSAIVIAYEEAAFRENKRPYS